MPCVQQQPAPTSVIKQVKIQLARKYVAMPLPPLQPCITIQMKANFASNLLPMRTMPIDS